MDEGYKDTVHRRESIAGQFPGGEVVKNPLANPGDVADAGSIPGSGNKDPACCVVQSKNKNNLFLPITCSDHTIFAFSLLVNSFSILYTLSSCVVSNGASPVAQQ